MRFISLNSFVTRSNDFVEREKAFSRDVSHELRTPVASSRAAVELALSTPEGQSGKLNQFLLRVSRANKDMTHLIETFLILGREEQQHLSNESFNLHELVNTSFDKHDYLKRNADIKCVNAVAPNYNFICSKQYLAIIIDNLVRNALQHTNHGTVTVLIKNNQVIVQDTGAGMDDSCAQEPSHNVLDKSGVGLSIVKRLSDKQGWQVHVKSKLGEGTRVFVDI
jgi:signal transduction histidine kinase